MIKIVRLAIYPTAEKGLDGAVTRKFDSEGIKLAECESSWISPGINSLAKLTGKSHTYLETMFKQFLAPIEEIHKSISRTPS